MDPQKKIIKNIGAIFKAGYVPMRGNEKYGMCASYINCFAHACFNLPNCMIEKLDFSSPIFLIQEPFTDFGDESLSQTKSEMFDFIKSTGLQIDKNKPILKDNEWKVAVYFSEAYNRDFGRKSWHLLLQEKDGSWSGKNGFSPQVEHFQTLQSFLPWDLYNKFQLNDVFILKNPNVEENKKNETGEKQFVY